MNIGLILDPYNEKKAAGLGRSIFSLVRAIIEGHPEDHFVVFINGESAPRPIFQTKNYETVHLKTGLFWLDRGLKDFRSLDGFMFFTPIMPLFLKLHNTLVVVHDLAYRHVVSRNVREFLVRFLLRFVHGRSLKKAAHIVTVSHYTEGEVKKFYPTVAQKISVIYNGFESPTEKTDNPNLTTDPFFLYVGVMKPRKNPQGVVRAFNIFKEKTSLPHKLILTGHRSAGSFIDKEVELSPYKKDIVLAGYRTDAEVSYLLRQTTAFVFPSLLEGFGLPILEAMSVGTPVITSEDGAVAEVAGKAALLVNPKDPKLIAEAMVRVATDEFLRKELVKKGFDRTANFSWKRAGREYSLLIRDIAKVGKF